MLIHLLDADPDSAFKMARTLKAKYAGKNGFASIAYPKGKNNRMALMAIENGADQVESVINGIGERAGNASLEEIAVALHIRKDFYQAESTIQLNEIKRTSDLVSKLTGMAVPRNKAVVGDNAFAHESGIHQDGFLKEKTTYEIISPELVGVKTDALVLGKHSGRHAFKDKLQNLGFQLGEEEINKGSSRRIRWNGNRFWLETQA